MEGRLVERTDNWMVTTPIFKGVQSFTGKEIKKWCKYHIDNGGEFVFEAINIFTHLWVIGPQEDKHIDNKAFYFVKIEPKNNNLPRIERDNTKSPVENVHPIFGEKYI